MFDECLRDFKNKKSAKYIFRSSCDHWKNEKMEISHFFKKFTNFPTAVYSEKNLQGIHSVLHSIAYMFVFPCSSS